MPMDTDPSASARQSFRKVLDNPWAMLGMLFFVTAALGIPFLWASRAFSAPVKWLLTVVVLLYTAFVLWVFWLIMAWCWSNISSSMGWS